MNKLKIAILSDDYYPAATGVGQVCQIICKILAKMGHTVSVVTSCRSGQSKHVETTSDNISIHRVDSKTIFGFCQALPSEEWLSDYLSSFKPDIVHYHYLGLMTKRCIHVINSSQQFSRSITQIFTFHMTIEHLTQPLIMKPFKPWIEKQIGNACQSVELVLSVSSNLAVEISTKYDISSSKIRYISNPIEFPDPSTIESLERCADFQILFVGRLNPEKNVPLLLRAFNELLKINKKNQSACSSTLWIAGSGNDEKKLKRLSEKLGLSGHVKFLGFIDHSLLSKYYKSCDILVLPSFTETQGLVAMEAMWFSKPIIVSSQIVSCSELVDRDQLELLQDELLINKSLTNRLGLNGFICDPDNMEDLSSELLELQQNNLLRATLGEEGRKKSNEYSPQLIVEQLLDTYQNAIHSKIGETHLKSKE